MAIKSYVKDGKKFFLVTVKMRDAAGKQHFKSRQGITSERKAKDLEFDLKKEVEKLATLKPGTDWESWLNTCLGRMKLELRPSTVINYEGRLNKWVTPLWAKRDIQSISKSDVHQLIFELIPPEEMSLYSRRTTLKMIKRIFQMALEDGLIDRHPCLGLSVRVPDADQMVLTNDEVEIFLREAKLTDHRFYPVWVMALLTGMRSGELYALEWGDIDLDGKIIRVNKQWTNKNGITATKTGRSRVVPISDDLVTFLKAWKLRADPNSKLVLPRLKEWENGEQARVTGEFCQAIGITKVKFHDLRATFITNLLSRGVSLARVMAVVGHSQIKTTNGYLRKAGVELKGTTNELGYSLPTQEMGQVVQFQPVGHS